MLPLALIAAGGANAQAHWDLACTADEQYAGFGSGSTIRPWFDVQHTGNHYNLDCTGSGGYMHVHCWDGDSAAIAWLEDASNNSWSSSASGCTAITATSWLTGAVVEDADVVLHYNSGDPQAIVFFIMAAANGDRVPTVSLYEYSGCTNGAFSLAYSLFPGAPRSHLHSSSPNIDISDNDDVVITWADRDTIFGMTVTVGSGTLSANTLVTVATPSFGVTYRDPDITINGASDTVSVTYIETDPDGFNLLIKQSSLTNFTNGIIWGPTTLVSAGITEVLSAPRIASPNTMVDCPGGSGCENDYVVVVGYQSGAVWRIHAYNMYDGSTYSKTDVNDDANSPSIDCYVNDKPVVGWTDDGIQVAWELHHLGGGCGDEVSGTSTCAGPEGGPDEYIIHVIVEHLDEELIVYDDGNGNLNESYSVFNRHVGEILPPPDAPDSLAYLFPSLTEGEGTVNIPNVLITSFWINTHVAITKIPEVIFKENLFTDNNLKRGDKDESESSENTAIYPNPFSDRLIVRGDDLPASIHSATVQDILGRSYAVELESTGENGVVTVWFPQAWAMSTGNYVLSLYGVKQKKTLRIVKAE